jgi:chemotaxis protein methyltransferase CheR
MGNEIKLLDRYEMTDEDFGKVSTYVNKELGIKLPYPKKVMLQCRLHKRVTDLKMSSFTEYFNYVFSNGRQQDELIKMIDLVTTNKTDFFRESSHFDFLKEVVLPKICSNLRGRKIIRIWSAACSSGEEPYTIAIVLKEFLRDHPDIDFEITGTDISLSILRKAADAVYNNDRISGISMDLKRKYFLKSKNPLDNTVRLIPDIRSRVIFRRMNLMNPYYDIDKEFDIIFCRNVLIYFDRETQQNVINKLASKLKHDGWFFLGHSETITNMKVPLSQIRPTVFRKSEYLLGQM